jgi:hypothetical protein
MVISRRTKDFLGRVNFLQFGMTLKSRAFAVTRLPAYLQFSWIFG